MMTIEAERHYIECARCRGTGKPYRTCRDCDGKGAVVIDLSWFATLCHNLAVAGFGALMFRAGDNFGFHMGAGEDFGPQCTCQWSPGEPYRAPHRCRFERSRCDDEECTCSRSRDDLVEERGFPCSWCGRIVR